MPKAVLFDSQFVYPHDHVGAYVELVGPVVAHATPGDDDFSVDVETEYGVIQAFATPPFAKACRVGAWARIRYYQCGGGHYPDACVLSLGPAEAYLTGGQAE